MEYTMTFPPGAVLQFEPHIDGGFSLTVNTSVVPADPVVLAALHAQLDAAVTAGAASATELAAMKASAVQLTTQLSDADQRLVAAKLGAPQ